MEMIREGLQMSGTHVICSAGMNNGKFLWKIKNGIAPYKVELKRNDPNPVTQWDASAVYRTITGIPAQSAPDEVNCVIEGLEPGAYKFRIYDSGDPTIQKGLVGSQQMNMGFSDWDVVQAPLCTIRCKVNTKGLPCTVYFELGETDAYGTTLLAGVPTGVGEVEMSLKLSAGDYSSKSILRPNKTYHYRAKLVSPGLPDSYGEDMTFQTPAIVPSISTLPAKDIQ